ncbi:MFS transporter [Caulobacter segnis]
MFAANSFCRRPRSRSTASSRTGSACARPSSGRVGVLVLMSGAFFAFVYGPLLKANLLLGAIVGGVCLGVTFSAGSFAIGSYVDRAGLQYGLNTAAPACGAAGLRLRGPSFGPVVQHRPDDQLRLASVAGLMLLPLWPSPGSRPATTSAAAPTTSGSLGRPGHPRSCPQFWGFMVLILGVTTLYLVYDQQFPRLLAGFAVGQPAAGSRRVFGLPPPTLAPDLRRGRDAVRGPVPMRQSHPAPSTVCCWRRPS